MVSLYKEDYLPHTADMRAHIGKPTTTASPGIKMVMAPPGFPCEARFVYMNERCPEHRSLFSQPVHLGDRLRIPAYRPPRPNYRRWKYEDSFKPTWPESHDASRSSAFGAPKKKQDRIDSKNLFLPSVAHFTDGQWPEDMFGEDEDTSIYYTAPSKQCPTPAATCVFAKDRWPEDDFGENTSLWYTDTSDKFAPSTPSEALMSSEEPSSLALSTDESSSSSEASDADHYEAAERCLASIDADIERLNVLLRLLKNTTRQAKLASRARQKQRKQRDLDRRLYAMAQKSRDLVENSWHLSTIG